MIDTHVHSLFSPDSEATPLEIALEAKRKNAKFIGVADHVDLNHPSPDCDGVKDFYAYFDAWEGTRRTAGEGLDIGIGVELGYAAENIPAYLRLTRDYPFDFVINSLHVVDGADCYFAEYFEGKEQRLAYERYFEELLASLDAPYYYSTVAHFGYVARNAPYPFPQILMKDYGDYIDTALKTIINKDKILELNTSARGAGEFFLPGTEILTRYKELGGGLITIGSDAHYAKNIGKKYKEAADLALALGFKELAYVKARRLHTVELF